MAFPNIAKQIVIIMKMKNSPRHANERIYSIFCNVYEVLLLIEYPISDNKKQTKAPTPKATSIKCAPNKKVINEKPKDCPNINNTQTVILNPIERWNIFDDQIVEINDEIIINEIAIENTTTTNIFPKLGSKFFMNE